MERARKLALSSTHSMNQSSILAQEVAIITTSLQPNDIAFVNSVLISAIQRLNASQSRFTEDEKKAINQIKTITITGSDKTFLGETSHQGMTLSLDYIKQASINWIASLLSHEGQHALNTGEFKGVDLWKDEQRACQVQLSVGKKLGFTTGESSYLENWSKDSNYLQMECHMEQGYQC